MKRDLNLIQEFLELIEEKENDILEIIDINNLLDKYDYHLLAYNFNLLKQNNYIKNFHIITDTVFGGTLIVSADSLTWEGHNLLDKLRKEQTVLFFEINKSNKSKIIKSIKNIEKMNNNSLIIL